MTLDSLWYCFWLLGLWWSPYLVVDPCGGVTVSMLIVCLLHDDDGGGCGAKLTRPTEVEETTLIDSVGMDSQA